MRSAILQYAVAFCVALSLIVATELLPERTVADHQTGLHEARVLMVGLHHSINGIASYTTCTSDPGDEAVWRYGGDTWQKYMLSSIALVHIPSCSTSSSMRVVMQWEYPGLTDCDDFGQQMSYACWNAHPSGWFSHNDQFPHDHLSQSYMLFDSAFYSPLAFDWKSRIAAHEWGHALSLADHYPSPSACTPDRIMENPAPVGGACVLNPNHSEVCSVWDAYGYVRNTDNDSYPIDGCDVDADNDGCSNIEELGPDQLFGGRRAPLFKWDFYDVNSTMKVDGIDVQLVRVNFNGSGPTPPEDLIFDRSPGVAAWAPGPPDNAINAIDIGLVQQSFNHSCVAPP